MADVKAAKRDGLNGAPTGFIPWRWKKHTVSTTAQVINRPLYELCLLEWLANALDK